MVRATMCLRGRDTDARHSFNGRMDVPVAPIAEQEDAPLIVARPHLQTAPVIFASPHSGRCYGADFLAAARLDPHSLRRSEDSFVEELFAAAPEFGAPLLSATFPRAYCDVNREPWELDPAMFADILPPWVNTTSPRVSAGLGTIARVVASGDTIYRGKLTFAEAERRVETYWRPFHETLIAMLTGTHALHGFCLLIDCHSMPSPGHSPGTAPGSSVGSVPGGPRPMPRNGMFAPDFVLGDAHGTACSPRITRFVERALTEFGYSVRRNDPYAGGYITRHYGRPRDRVHALQIEVARSLYMDEARIERSPSFASVQADLTSLVEAITREASSLIDD